MESLSEESDNFVIIYCICGKLYPFRVYHAPFSKKGPLLEQNSKFMDFLYYESWISYSDNQVMTGPLPPIPALACDVKNMSWVTEIVIVNKHSRAVLFYLFIYLLLLLFFKSLPQIGVHLWLVLFWWVIKHHSLIILVIVFDSQKKAEHDFNTFCLQQNTSKQNQNILFSSFI